MKFTYELFDDGFSARIARWSYVRGKVTILFLSGRMHKPVKELYRMYGYSETARLVITNGGGRERWHFDLEPNAAGLLLEKWRKQWRVKHFVYNVVNLQPVPHLPTTLARLAASPTTPTQP
jgi:hypothetical protein